MTLDLHSLAGVLIPFAGTSLGAAGVLFLKRDLTLGLRRGLTGFAAGVMVAASIWSLLIPAIDRSASLGTWAFFPAAAGFWCGILFLLALDRLIPHLHVGSEEAEGPRSTLSKTTMLVLAVTIHNIPEGMAVGAVFAGYLSGDSMVTLGGALVLSLGIAIQNFPEGAIISLPLRAEGVSRRRALWYGVLSGIVEPAAALITILAPPFGPSCRTCSVLPPVPCCMWWLEELIPEMSEGPHSNIGTLTFALGFTVMMILDVALG